MKLFLDSANLDHVREIHAMGVLAGVTTNPSLIAKEGRDFIQTVYDIAELVQGPVSAEVVAQDREGMVREGRLLAKVHPHIVVKDANYEKLSEWLWSRRYQLLDRSRVQIFEICQNLTRRESADLYFSLKTAIEQASSVDKDAATW